MEDSETGGKGDMQERELDLAPRIGPKRVPRQRPQKEPPEFSLQNLTLKRAPEFRPSEDHAEWIPVPELKTSSAWGILFFNSSTNESRVEFPSRVDFFSCGISGQFFISMFSNGRESPSSDYMIDCLW
jgi:hypothetical protein